MIRHWLQFGFLLIIMISCSGKKQPVNGKIITVSIPPQAYFIERLAGKEYQINVLVPPGMGPETYEPSPGDLEKVAASVFCFFSGYLDFETQLRQKISSWKSKPVMVDLSENLILIRNQEHGEGKEMGEGDHHHIQGVDPHYWMSVKEMKKVTQKLCDLLIGKNPDEQASYLKNRDLLLNDLNKLDSTLTIEFKDLKTRTFIVFHPSLSYLSRDYNLQQVSLEHSGKQPSTRQMALLVDIARKEGIKTVFLQSQFDKNNMQALATEINGKFENIDPLSSDWLNNMYLITNKLKEAMHGN